MDHDLGGKILTYRGVTFQSIDKEREREENRKREGIILVKFKL